MISGDQQNKLNAAAMQVFGTMYFTPIELLAELPDMTSNDSEDTFIKVTIGYKGPHQAELSFYFPHRLASHIAGGFLGIEEESLVEGQITDTIQESANMIVGNYLGRIDEQGECALGIPKAELVDSRSLKQQVECNETLAFISDFGIVWLFLS